MIYKFIGHELNVDLWESKESLKKSFYTDFYNFIKENGGEGDLAKHNIQNASDFVNFADFYAGGMKDCYAIGFAFHKYFLEARMDGSLQNEPETTFIGWCVKNNKYTDFINFLITFFAWWRNDEGCTCMDPYNYADNFFVGSWAALVDTSKLFYYTAETVHFWQSYRVKYAIDNIPGTFMTELPKEGLPKIRVAGYEFLGWFNSDKEDAEPAKETDEVAYARLKRHDFYDYWGSEEKKIKKVYIKDWKKVDPA